MANFDILPGTLNVRVARGDTFSCGVDFSQVLTGYTVSGELKTLTDGRTALPLTVAVSDAAAGEVQMSLTAEQTADLARGTYSYELQWQNGAEIRTALKGIFEIL